MDEVRHYDMSEAELAAHPTVFGEKLMAGQTVMVSGAGRGIGRSIATPYARLGANLAICGRNEERLEASAAFLRGFGRLDTQINNAGG